MVMQVEGLHHITAITGDAQSNVDFYTGLLGLRLVKKTVNFDQPAEHALLGFHGVRAYASRPEASAALLEQLGIERDGEAVWRAQGAERHALLRYDEPPAERGRQSAGTVHHIAWSLADDAELD